MATYYTGGYTPWAWTSSSTTSTSSSGVYYYAPHIGINRLQTIRKLKADEPPKAHEVTDEEFDAVLEGT